MRLRKGLRPKKIFPQLAFYEWFFKVGKREKVGTLMGKDPFGNSYYELPAQPQVQIWSTKAILRSKKADFESTLHSWESGCLLVGMTLHRPTEKRFNSLKTYLEWGTSSLYHARWWECTNLQLALTPTYPQNGMHIAQHVWLRFSKISWINSIYRICLKKIPH